jgi:hypothetical protein
MSIPPGLYVRLDDVYNNRIAANFKDIPQYYLSELTGTNSEAEELLTEICNDAFHSICEDYITSTWVRQLKEWWTKTKPKTEREEKLEAVVRSISLNGEFIKDLLPVAERILQALGL